MTVHPTAVVAKGAEIDESADVGAYAIIEDGVFLGRGSKVRPFAILCERTIVGEQCEIGYGAVVGAPAQHTVYHNAPSRARIGNRVIIREYATIHRSISENGETIVGDDCYLMAFSHIGHDCELGRGVILTHLATLGGHCHVGDQAVIGGAVVVHQRVDIGTLAMVGGASGVSLGVLPYAMVFGRPPAKIIGVNVRGLERAGIPRERIQVVEEVFRLIRRTREREQLLRILESEIDETPERNEIIKFLSQRGPVSHF
ncbi:MAG: acyl-ACP--UDP-N-acetylglucosamine O-acyltransferase [bacterium JZ-2024 1]